MRFNATGRVLLAIFCAASLFAANLAGAQTCNVTKIRFALLVPAWSSTPYLGDYWFVENPSQRMPAAEVACQEYAAQWGQVFADLRFPAANGYTANGYRDLHTDGSGCMMTLYGIHITYGEQTAGIGAGNESNGGAQCPPPNPLKTPGADCNNAGNPINLATGNKYQVEQDYRSADGTLEFSRHYNSRLPQPGVASPFLSALGSNWRSTYDRAIRVGQTVHPVAYVYRPDGKTFMFSASGNTFITDLDVTDRLEKRLDASNVFIGWRYRVSQSDEVETYDAAGRLLSITNRTGMITSLAYDSLGRLASVSDAFGKSLSFSYDSANRLASLIVPGGQSYIYAYDVSNNVSGVTQPNGTTRTYTYNEAAYTDGGSLPTALTGILDESGSRYATFRYSNTLLARATEHAGGVDKYEIQYPSTPTPGVVTFLDPLGQSRTLTFAAVQGVPRVTSSSARSNLACARHKSAQFDTQGNMVAAVDFKNIQTTYGIDTTRNLLTRSTEAAGTPFHFRTIFTTWHATYRLPVQIQGAGRVTGFTHDANGNVLTKTDRDLITNASRTWTYTYNSYGKVLSYDGPVDGTADTTTYTYYNCATGAGCGQVQTVTNALGHTTSYLTYNAHGQPLTMRDANGVLTTMAYDLRQRLTSRAVGSETTSFEYWPTGLLKKVIQPDGNYFLYDYDAAHRLTEIQDSEGNRVVYTLDPMGNRIKEELFDPSNALAQTRSRVFDTLSRLQQEIGAAGTEAVTTTYGYDDNDNQISIAAPLGRNAGQNYDPLNRLARVTDAFAGVTQYNYNALDQLISVTDPRNKVTTYTYNALGDLLSQTSPDTERTTNTYDTGGNLITSKDTRNKTATYGYDALNRVTSVSYPDQLITYTYDTGWNQKGRLTQITDNSGSTSWTYDPQGRVLSRQQGMGFTKTLDYAYDTSGRLHMLTLPSGITVTYGYNDGKVTSLTLNGTTTILSNVLYQSFGPIRGWTWGNATLAVREYNPDGLVIDIDSAGLKTYAYDDAFRITGITDASNAALSQSYGYDLLDRLTSATGTGLNQSWTYDANGNRVTQGGSSASTYVVSTSNNHLASVSGALSRTYTYDNAGNTTSDGAATFAYNDAGRIVSATKAGVATTYAINALGQRVKKTSGSVSRYFVYDESGHLIGEYDSSGNLIQETVWFGDIPAAVLKPNASSDVDVFYVHTDHLNTPRRISRPSDNAIVWRWDSDPFGTNTANEDHDGDSNQFVFNLRFPGQYYDSETGLHYNYFRDYDPATGRYLQSDPIGLEGGINTYAYANGNPVSNVDPLGLEVGAAFASVNRATAAVLGLRSPPPSDTCERCECWLTCLSEDPLLPELLAGLGVPLLNLKRPGEMRPGASPWTSVDRRLPPWTGANPNAGATVTRGTIQRVKCVGRYGTVAAAVGAFTAGYTVGAAGRCWVECL